MDKACDYDELVETELRALGVDRFVKTFEYSDQEWAEIELSAQPTLKGPLTEEVRQCLCRAGNVYLILHSTGEEFLKEHKLTFVANWENIGGLAAELFEQLSEANARSADQRKYRRLLKALAKLRDDAPILSAKSPPLSPREDYYREILGVWVDKLGGELQVSRGTVTHKLSGPLVRFFQAVTRPVLATEAPALETISRIVKRERERRNLKKERHKKHREQGPTQMAGFIKEPTPMPHAADYTDLGSFRTDPDTPLDRQVHDYVVERGRATGVQYFVAVAADGTVLAHGSGTPDSICIPEKLNDALDDPANKIVIHRNNPSSTGLNPVDIGYLALPGLEAICRHGNGGNVARGALTPEARAMLRGNSREEAFGRLYRIASGIGWFRLYEVLHPMICSGKISFDQATMVNGHFVGLTLRRAGILDYRFESAPARRKSACATSIIPRPGQMTSSTSSRLKPVPARSRN